MLPTNVPDLLAGQARLVPRAPAIEALERAPLDHQGLVAQVDSFRAELARRGVGRGARVGMVLDTGPEMAVACLGAMAGAACVPLNPEYTRAELEALLRLLRVELLVTQPAHAAARAAARAADLPVLELIPRAGGKAGELELSADARSSGQAELQAPGPDDLALVLHTSGSTARPKVVPLTHRNLLEASSNVVRTLELGRDDRCLSALPMYHVGALVDLLLAPLSVGGAVVVAPDMTAGSFFACLRALRPSWYQGVPTMLQDILHRARIDGVEVGASGLRFVRSVSAPLPPAVLDEFEQRFGVPVIEIYGMTETAGVITSNPLPPGERRPGSVGVSAGPELVIVDGAGNAVAAGRLGEVCVRGASVTAGYERAPDLSPDTSRDDGAFIGDWLRTGDEGRLDEDGYLFITGRIKEIVNRGGEKISPREVDEVALAHPDVKDAAAFALPHDTLGEEVGLAVVRRAGAELEADELAAFCAARLAQFKVPRRVFFVDELPRTSGGKLQRVRLAEALGSVGTQPASGERVEPVTELAKTLVGMWEHTLGVSGFGVHDDFFELGGDSLKAATFIQQLQDRMGLQLPASAFYDGPTVAELEQRLVNGDGRSPVGDDQRGSLPLEVHAELLRFLNAWEGSRSSSDSLLVGRNTLGSRRPLFWCANGRDEFAMLADSLGADQPVFGMRSLLDMNSRPLADARKMARRYVHDVLEMQGEGPFLLGGFCAGGTIAFELARELQKLGHEVGLLCMQEQFVPRPFEGRLALVFCAPDIHSRFHRRLGPARGKNRGPYVRLPDPISWFERRVIAAGAEFQPYRLFVDPARGWTRYYSGSVGLHLADVWHGDCYKEPHLRRFAEILRDELDDATDGAARPSSAPVYRGKARADLPLSVTAEAEPSIRVTLTNEGEEPWVGSPDGTLCLTSRWSRNGLPRIGSDTRAFVVGTIPSGMSTTVVLRLRAPARPGAWQLELDLAEGGRTPSGEGGAPLSCRTVVVLPGAETLSRAVFHIKRSFSRVT